MSGKTQKAELIPPSILQRESEKLILSFLLSLSLSWFNRTAETALQKKEPPVFSECLKIVL